VYQIGCGASSSPAQHRVIIAKQIELFQFANFQTVLESNLGDGQVGRLLFTVEVGRVSQMLGLFVVGLLLGRTRLLETSQRTATAGRRALVIGFLSLAVLYPLARLAEHFVVNGSNLELLTLLLKRHIALAQAALWFGAFVLLYPLPRVRKLMTWLASYGRMSLTNYVFQGQGAPFQGEHAIRGRDSTTRR